MTPSSPPSIRCVLFDVGGVLVELAGIGTMLEWLDGRVDADGLWQAWLESPAVRDYERGRIGTDTFATALVAEFGLRVDAPTFLAAFVRWPRGPLPGAHDLLGRLRPDLVRACLSNSNALHWERLMGEMGFAAHFDHAFASHLIDRIKPDREAFEHVCETLGLEPGEIVFLDDNRLNVDGARAAGLRAHRCVGPAEAAAQLEALGLLAR